ERVGNELAAVSAELAARIGVIPEELGHERRYRVFTLIEVVARSAARTAWMKSRRRATSFLPGRRSVALQASIPKGRTLRTRSAAESGVNRPLTKRRPNFFAHCAH